MILRKKMKIFLNIQLFQNDQVQNSCQNIMKPRKTKSQATKGSLFFLSLWNLCLPFYRRDARVRRVLGLRTSSSCHWHPFPRVCVCLLINDGKCYQKYFRNGRLSARLGGHPSYIRSFPLSPRDHDIPN